MCAALESGRQMVLLRKGGIHDAGGVFEVENREFLLFPTYLHQKPELLKPDERAGFAARGAEPEEITLSSSAEVTDILCLHSRRQMDAIDDAHIWTPAMIDMRFNYKPKNPLYLLLLRVWRLSSSKTIPNTPEYEGCKSWVPLEASIDISGRRPALDDAVFATMREAILQGVAGHR